MRRPLRGRMVGHRRPRPGGANAACGSLVWQVRDGVSFRLADGLPARDCWLGATPAEGGLAVHVPNPPGATPGTEKGGSLRPRPQVPARRSRPGGRGATTNRTMICVVAGLHVRNACSRTCTRMSHVRSGPAARRSAVKACLRGTGSSAILRRCRSSSREARIGIGP